MLLQDLGFRVSVPFPNVRGDDDDDATASYDRGATFHEDGSDGSYGFRGTGDCDYEAL